jgi:hypothetical protein
MSQMKLSSIFLTLISSIFYSSGSFANHSMPLNYFKEGNVFLNYNGALKDVYFQNGKMIEKPKLNRHELYCHFYKSSFIAGDERITQVFAKLEIDILNKTMKSFATLSGHEFTMTCEQSAPAVKMQTFADIERTFGSVIQFKITQDELADKNFFEKWINLKNLYLKVFDNGYWKESYNPRCAVAYMDEISMPENCFGVSPDDAVLIDFRGNSSTFYHKVKHNHEHIASYLGIYFEVEEQIYSNRPGSRTNMVFLKWYDQVGPVPGSSDSSFYTELKAPKDSRVSPSLEDFKSHLGKTFEVTEK